MIINREELVLLPLGAEVSGYWFRLGAEQNAN